MQIPEALPADSASPGRLAAMLMRTHYEFDLQRFLAPHAGVESGYPSFPGSLLDSDEVATILGLYGLNQILRWFAHEPDSIDAKYVRGADKYGSYLARRSRSQTRHRV